MNILIIGSGGREHTLAWKTTQSTQCDNLYIAPGNAGTGQVGTNVALDLKEFETVGKFCLENEVGMVIVGPEEPLVRGIYDHFHGNAELAHIRVIGPSQEGAQLEGSKAYAKEFMSEFNIPTAAYREFTADNVEDGVAYIATQPTPIVLKADGLAAGKGVLIIDDITEAQEELRKMLDGKFGAASSKVIIEEFLDGIEFSVFVVTDGKSYKLLPVAKDYKRIGEGDTGLNTGGMGAVSPVSFVDDRLMQKVEDQVVKPTILGLQKRNIVYKGFIFFGLIRVNGEPYVIEYNCRMGDPETEVVIPRLENDLVELLTAVADETLSDKAISISKNAAATIMLVSQGYPEAYEKGKVMTGFESVSGSLLFHAGTKEHDGQVVTNGGRVIAITSYGEDFKAALETSRLNAKMIGFEGKNYRKDIGFDL
ncbi:MAG: phosphoribosylamine--glycine ligase [Bacteroidota bacterium]